MTATTASTTTFARSVDASEDPFFRVARTRRTTSEGVVELPILYRDVSNVVAFFWSRRVAVEPLLEGTNLEPAMGRGDRCVVALSFYEYRKTSVGEYNEVGLAIPVVRHGERPLLGAMDMLLPPSLRTIGALVIDLPVTTRTANAAGREIWGYPKFVTRIPFHLRGRTFDAEVEDPKGESRILRVAGRMGPGLPTPALSLMTYTFLDGALIRTHVDVRGFVFARAPGSVRLEAGRSSHPMAEHVRELGLHGERPWLLLTTHRFQSKLYEGARVA